MARCTAGCVILAFVAGCGPGVEDWFEDGLRRVSTTLEADRKGRARLGLRILEEETALLVTSSAEEGLRTHVQALDLPEWGTVFDAFEEAERPFHKTNGGLVAQVASLNWPILTDDRDLLDGRAILELGVVDPAGRWAPGEIVVDVLSKEDADLEEGALHASIIYAGGVDDDPAVVAATEEALGIWADRYALLGIALSWEFFSYEDGDLAPPGLGSSRAYQEIAAMTPLRTVRIVLVPDISGHEDVYAVPGATPAPLVSTASSAAVVSVGFAAGPDGTFSAEELRLFGETMAHEAGHLLGLFHPVEADYLSWDDVADTEACDYDLWCWSKLGSNLMFPFPFCEWTTCTPQDQVTEGQAAVANRHVAVD